MDPVTPIVAIVGRPNVGKSTLLNRLAGRRISIVEPTAGVTRDRVEARVKRRDARFLAVDTGGIMDSRHGILDEAVEAQVERALGVADAILFLVDVKDGLHPLDRKVAERLRGLDRPVLLVANKAESTRDLEGEFFSLGLGEPLRASAKEGEGISDLMEALVERVPAAAPRDEEPGGGEEPEMRLALLGRRNVGKSTLVNALADDLRVIVSEMPGTTRDAVDVHFTRGGRSFIVIDTAGVRRRGKVDDAVEFFSTARSEKALRRADVCVLMLECADEIARVDKALAAQIEEAKKPAILAVSKWDLSEGASREDFTKFLRNRLPGLAFAPIITTSGLDHEGLDELVDTAHRLFEQGSTRVGTGELNRIVEAAMEERAPRTRRTKTKNARVYYATQVGTLPPVLALFVNDPTLFDKQWERFLVGRLRAVLPFKEVPVRILFRSHRRKGEGAQR